MIEIAVSNSGGDCGEKTPRSNSIEIIEKIRNLNTVNTET